MEAKVGRSTLIIAGSLIVSRVLGILRDVLLAENVGVGPVKNAYDLAFLIPDIINHLVSTGYLSITFIPIFTGYLVKNRENEAWDFFSNVLGVLGVLFLILTGLAWVFTEPLILMLTTTRPDAETLALAVKYSRILLPAQFCFFAGAFLVSIQHIRQRFFIPSLTGLVYNASIIIGGYLSPKGSVDGFVWGVVVGAVIGSLVLQIYGGVRSGAQYRFQFNPLSRDFLHFCKITIPLILGIGATFSLEFVYRSFGSEFGPTGISTLGYAYRIMFAIVAVFGFAVGVASYPMLSRLAKEGNFDEINRHLFGTLARILALLSSCVLIVWFSADLIVQFLYHRGAFDLKATLEVSQLLRIYLLGAFAMSGQVIIVRCFYALEKTWVPALLNTGIFLGFLPIYSAFGQQFGIAGIPLAGGICVTAQVIVLLAMWIRIAGVAYCSDFLKEAAKIFFLFILTFGLISWLKNNWLAPSFSNLALFIYLSCFSAAILLIQTSGQLLLKVKTTTTFCVEGLQKLKILRL